MPRCIYFLLVLMLASVCFAAETDLEKEFPYRAQIIGSDVYVRSGSGIQYYFTGKLNEPAEVIVVDKRFSWCKIVPPAGSFSWIAKEFVKLDANKPGKGVVSNDNVRIWAGAGHLDPEDSTSPQGKLNTGDKVQLLGEESGDYYKIAPPAGALLWIKGDYLKYIGPADVPAVKTPKPAETPKKPVKKPSEAKPAEPKAEKVEKPTAPVVAKDLPKPRNAYELRKIKEVYNLIKAVDQERAKPLAGQDYTALVKSLKGIAADKKAGLAIKYARCQLDRIAGYQLAKEVADSLAEQDIQLEKIRNQIREKYQSKRAKVVGKGIYDVKGRLKKSMVYDSKAGLQRYLVIDENGRIICYAIPVGRAMGMDMDTLVGSQVGLTGEFVADAASGISLLKFNDIALLQETVTEEVEEK